MGEPTAPSLALPALLQLVHQWAQLLLEDPGLPASLLDADWPSRRSTLVFARLLPELRPLADAEYELLGAGTGA